MFVGDGEGVGSGSGCWTERLGRESLLLVRYVVDGWKGRIPEDFEGDGVRFLHGI